MTTDPFTEAAQAEGVKRWPPYTEAVFFSMEERPVVFRWGAEWARDHLAAQEPTDAEVEAAARAIHINTFREFDDLGGLDQHALRVRARAALSAARRTRGGTT